MPKFIALAEQFSTSRNRILHFSFPFLNPTAEFLLNISEKTSVVIYGGIFID